MRCGHTFSLGRAGCTLAAACALSAQAQPWELHVSHPRGLLITTERNASGQVINTESGALVGLRVAAARELGRWRLEAEHSLLEGDLAYLGFSQLGAVLRTTSSYRWQQPQATLWAPTWEQGAWGLRAGVSVGALRLDRRINDSALNDPLQEVLHQRQVGWSVAAAYKPLRSTGLWPAQVQLQAQRLRASGSRLAINAYGVIDPLTLYPQARSSQRWQLGSAWALAPQTALQFSMGQRNVPTAAAQSAPITANGQPAGQASYPGGSFWLREAGLGLNFSW